MTNNARAQAFLKELEAEYPATRKCLQAMRMDLADFQPHETSMKMGYLAALVAAVPLWIQYMITEGAINLATLPRFTPQTTAELVKYLDENVEAARTALSEADDELLRQPFVLKHKNEVLYETLKIIDIPVTLNHWVHHRGQFTVYMRMNGLAVPAIYGASADDPKFQVPR